MTKDKDFAAIAKDLLISAKNFDTMLTSKLIVLLYWVLLFITIVCGLGSILKGSFIAGILILTVGVLSVRVWCELFIVLFKIHDNLKKIADNQSKK